MTTPETIVLCGPVAPPKGGVSVHIDRLSTALRNIGLKVVIIDESPIIKNSFFNLRSFRFVQYLNIISKARVVHVHSSVPLFLVLHLLVARFLGKRVVITVHSWRHNNLVSWFIAKIAVPLADRTICVSVEIDKLLNSGNACVLPAFLPPVLENEDSLGPEIDEWIRRNRGVNNIIIASNAYKLELNNGADLYGLDMAVSAMDYLVNKKHISVAMVFIVASLRGDSKQFFDGYLKKIRGLGLSDNLLLHSCNNLSFVRLITFCDLTLRATNTDGDALSVRESLYLNVPVVASDVVERPPSTILYRNRDQESLNTILLNTIINLRDIKIKYPREDYWLSKYLSIYSLMA